MLARRYRLRDRRSVAKVYSKGSSARSHALSIKYLPNHLDNNRTTVVVSKKTAKQAPIRNRIRRRIYAILEDKPTSASQHYDAIISVFDADVASMPPAQLKRMVAELLSKAGIG